MEQSKDLFVFGLYMTEFKQISRNSEDTFQCLDKQFMLIS